LLFYSDRLDVRGAHRCSEQNGEKVRVGGRGLAGPKTG
jgi:hypothetical protein